jgi:hypothetical protein
MLFTNLGFTKRMGLEQKKLREPVMSNKVPLYFVWIIVACILCHVIALLLISSYYALGESIAYTEPMQWRQLLGGVLEVDFSAIKNGAEFHDWLLFGFAVLG